MTKQFDLGFTIKNVPGGTRMVMLYDDFQDLIEIMPLFFAQGLKNKEKCLLIYPNNKVKEIMKKEISKFLKLNSLKEEKNFELINYKEFYYNKDQIDPDKPIKIIDKKLNVVDYTDVDGIRALGDMSWIDNKVFNEIINVEKGVTKKYLSKDILFLVTYPVHNLSASEIIEIIQSYVVVLYKKDDMWSLSETIERTSMQAEIKDLKKFTNLAINRELEMVKLKEENRKLKEKKY